MPACPLLMEPQRQEEVKEPKAPTEPKEPTAHAAAVTMVMSPKRWLMQTKGSPWHFGVELPSISAHVVHTLNTYPPIMPGRPPEHARDVPRPPSPSPLRVVHCSLNPRDVHPSPLPFTYCFPQAWAGICCEPHYISALETVEEVARQTRDDQPFP